MANNIINNHTLIERNYPKVLVVSYNCFSQSVSTGRTLANLFWGWDKKAIAQLYMSNEIPDNDVCYHYYRVTDIDIINRLRRKITAGVVHPMKFSYKNKQYDETDKALYHKLKVMKEKRKIKMKLYRSFLWNLGLWKSSGYYQWLDQFQPEIIVVMAGENYFVDKIGLDISKRYSVPILVYDCENYQFKNYSRHGIHGILFQALLNRSFKKLMNRTNHVIFNNQSLRKLFQKRYNMNASVVYISSILDSRYSDNSNKTLRISYLGNIQSRYKSLIEIAKTIKKIDNKLSLDVYGKAEDELARQEIINCRELDYHGFVSYQEVLEIIAQSDILVHCESFDQDEIIDKRFAFSTKIADTLASGSCFFVYAPKSNAAAQYLMKKRAACVVTEEGQLENKLKGIIENSELRSRYRKNALKIAKENHDIQRNADKVYEIIQQVVNEGYKDG